MKANSRTYPPPFSKWPVGLSCLFKNLTALFLFSVLLFSKSFAQVGPGTAPVNPPSGGFRIEGDLQANTPAASIGDWLPFGSGGGGSVLDASGVPLNNTTTFHLIDRYVSPDNNFAGGLKFDDNPNHWTWVTNPVNDKEDINNALIHFIHSSNGHLWVIVAADRKSNNGDAYIDFEFLQSALSTTGGPTSGGFSSSGPDGGRTENDFVLTLQLTKGGNTATFFVNRWQPVPVSTQAPDGFDYVDRTSDVPSGSVFAAVNNADGTAVPFGAFGNTTYEKNTFVEAAVDLTALLGAIETCTELGISTILVKTKESQSPTATIVDFVAPQQTSITIGVADAGTDKTKCAAGATTTFNLTGTATPSLGDVVTSTEWSVVGVDPAGQTAIIADPSLLNTTVEISDHATATLRLTVKTQKGCELSDDVVFTIIDNPTVFDLSSTDYCVGDPALGTVTLSNSQAMVSYQLKDASTDADVQSAKTGTGDPLTWTDIPAGTYKVVATAAGGCNSTTGTTTVQENQLPNAPSAEGASRCGPGTVDLTASGCDGGTLTWYDADGNQVGTGSTFTTPSLSTTTSFFVSCSNGGCESGKTEAVATVNPQLGTPTAIPTNPACGEITGSVQVDNFDASAGIIYELKQGGVLKYTADGTGLFSDVEPGTYDLVASKSGSCGATGSVTVDNPPTQLTTPTATPTSPKCGETTGSVQVDNFDASAGITYELKRGGVLKYTADGAGLFSPVDPDTYDLVASKSGSCNATGSVTVNTPPATPSAPSADGTSRCGPGTVQLTASGCDGGTLTWYNAATDGNILGTGSPFTTSSLSATTDFYVSCTSAGGCEGPRAKATATIKTIPSAPTGTNSTVCSPNTATASVSGCNGGTLTWSFFNSTGGTPTQNGSTLVQNGLGSTSYNVTCTVNGCTSQATTVTATVNNCSGIYPTQTSCSGFNSGTIQFLPQVCITTKKSKTGTTISGATPGVFFYYTKITAPSATFDVYIDQTKCSGISLPIAANSNQVIAWKNSCVKLATGKAVANGDATIHITGATAGQPVIISVQYNVKSLVGATVSSGFTSCQDNFVTELNTNVADPTKTIANTSANITISANCSAAVIAAVTASPSFSKEISSELKVTAAPNPYTSIVNFHFVSPVTGKANLEVYNLLGQKLAIVYSGDVKAGAEISVQYTVPAEHRVPMIYRLDVGNRGARGTLVPLE